MAVTAFLGEKGGIGKSTLAVNYAAMITHLRPTDTVIILDADPKPASSTWCLRRKSIIEEYEAEKLILEEGQRFSSDVLMYLSKADKKGFPISIIQGERTRGNITRTIQSLSEDFDHVIIDCGGMFSGEMNDALLLADYAVFPLKTGGWDLDTLSTIEKVVSNALRWNKDLIAKIVINEASSHPKNKKISALRESINKSDVIKCLNAFICRRTSYEDTSTDGLSVFELLDGKAKEELTDMFQELLTSEN